MKKYNKPICKIEDTEPVSIIASSNSSKGGLCSKTCKIYHMCKDRCLDVYCYDKQL